MKFPLLSKDEFISRIIEDFKQIFPVVNKERDYLYVKDDPTNMSIPFSSIYRVLQYQRLQSNAGNLCANCTENFKPVQIPD